MLLVKQLKQSSVWAPCSYDCRNYFDSLHFAEMINWRSLAWVIQDALEQPFIQLHVKKNLISCSQSCHKTFAPCFLLFCILDHRAQERKAFNSSQPQIWWFMLSCKCSLMWIKVHTDSSYFKTELTNEEKSSEGGNLRVWGGKRKIQCYLLFFTTTKRLWEQNCSPELKKKKKKDSFYSFCMFPGNFFTCSLSEIDCNLMLHT